MPAKFGFKKNKNNNAPHDIRTSTYMVCKKKNYIAEVDMLRK